MKVNFSIDLFGVYSKPLNPSLSPCTNLMKFKMAPGTVKWNGEIKNLHISQQ